MEVKNNDKFDYSVHEALSTIEKEDLPNNTIIDVIQQGWKLDKEVLRYAKVIISREPKPPEPEPESESEPQGEPESIKTETSEKESKDPDYIS